MSLVNLILDFTGSVVIHLVWKAPSHRRFSEDKTDLTLALLGMDSSGNRENQRGFTTTNDRLRCRQTERTWGWLGSSD